MPNRLKKEDSLVEWYPWCDEAFKKAQDENKAIFITIGYSSCQLCSKMEDEVFNNQECADILNKYFISIKVDSEKRPDIDRYYQEVYTLINNSAGGYPTSIFATPQNRAFYAGTYIALESQEGSIEGMGFKELSKLIGEKITQHDEQIYKNAEEVENFLNNKKHPSQATVLTEDFTKNFMHQVKNNYDTRDGGFSSAPKFPQVATLSTLLRIDELYDDRAAKAMLLYTLKSMIRGGIYDLKDGDFYRYAIDNEWRVPYHEKKLYDNALLCELYAKAYIEYGDEEFLKTAKSIADCWHGFLHIDAKDIQTSWSSMMIKALFTLGKVDAIYTKKAIDNLDTLTKATFIDAKLYHIATTDKSPNIEAFLEDYAFLSQALIDAYSTTKDELYIIQAQRFANTALEKFYAKGSWNFSDGEFKTKADISDNTYTSGVSAMVDVLLSLGEALKDEKYIHFAFKTLEYNSYELGRRPILYPSLLKQMLRYLKSTIKTYSSAHL